MTNNINGIDVSEEIRYCNNCSNLGLDFKAGKFYCSLSHRLDELPEVLSCDEFSANCYIKRLQEENKSLQMLSCANCGEKYLSPDGSELYEKNVQLQEENEELKKYQYTQEYLQSEIEKRQKALEEIRNAITESVPKKQGDYNFSKSLNPDKYALLEYIQNKINEALNDRD